MRASLLSACLFLQLLPDLRAEDFDSSLLGSVARGDLEAAKQALGKGAKVETRDDQGKTPLILAALAGKFELIKVLVEKGADVNARTTTETGSTVLAWAVGSKNMQAVEYLIAHGAGVDLKARNGSTPLCHASIRGENDLVALLLSKGADPNICGMRDNTGNYLTPLVAACLSNHIGTIQLLLSKGAKVEKRNTQGSTPLMEAAKRPYPAVVKLLIERGANVNAKGTHGHTALIYAGYNGLPENIKLLLSARADPLATATDDPDLDKESGRYGAEVVASEQGHPEALALIVDAQKRAKSVAGKP